MPSEHLTATQDGYIWPVARADMTDERAIVCRMEEDVERAGADVNVSRHLAGLGWTDEQVRRFAWKACIGFRASPVRKFVYRPDLENRTYWAWACLALPLAFAVLAIFPEV